MHSCTAVVPLFKNLSPKTRAQIDQLTREQTLPKGVTVLSPDHQDQLVVVAKGQLKTYQLAANGNEQLLRVAGPGDYEGDNTLLGTPNPNRYTTAMTPVTACTIAARDFKQLLLDQPQIGLEMLAVNAKRMQELEQQTGYLGNDSTAVRLANYLLDLKTATQSDQVTVPMAWRELANYLGTTPETISRHLKTLAAQHLITRVGRQVTLKDPEALEDFTW